MRSRTPLPPEVEAIVERVIAAAIEVHKQLGPGLREGLYEDALKIELKHQGLRFHCQQKVLIAHRGQNLRPQWIDLIVEDCVVVELKAVEMLHPVHQAQVITYLRATGHEIGLLFNFNRAVLFTKRIILTKSRADP